MLQHSKDNTQQLKLIQASPPGPFDEVREVVEQAECVVGISGNLCERPHDQE